MFTGYYKNKEKTAEAYTEDGWLNSGDVAIIYPNGSVKIIDRAKNIFKLSQGEYIAPEKLENVYVQSSYIAQVFVHGESLQSYLVAVVVPDPDAVKKYVTTHSLTPEEAKNILTNEGFKKAIQADMDELVKVNKLSGLEKIKKLHLSGDAFSIANDLLTPTMKLKRNVAKKLFQA
jgi:long-chain acyl-CoA synthetase